MNTYGNTRKVSKQRAVRRGRSETQRKPNRPLHPRGRMWWRAQCLAKGELVVGVVVEVQHRVVVGVGWYLYSGLWVQ